jgi:hypothetical protein
VVPVAAGPCGSHSLTGGSCTGGSVDAGSEDSGADASGALVDVDVGSTHSGDVVETPDA